MKSFLIRAGRRWLRGLPGFPTTLLLATLVTVPTVPPPAGAQDPAADRLLREAERLEAEGNPEAALEELHLLVQQFPQDALAPAALLRVIELRHGEERYHEARQSIEQLLQSYPRTPESAAAFVIQAEIQMAEALEPGQLEEARTAFRRVPLLYGSDVYPALTARSRARVRAAETGLLLEDGAAAVAELLAVIEDEPISSYTGRARLRLGQTWLRAGRWAAAAEVLERLARSGDDAATEVDRAHARRLLGLFHRRVLRPRVGQKHFATTARYPAPGAALREPSGVAAAEDGRLVVVDDKLSLVLQLDATGRETARRTVEDAGQPGWLDATPGTSEGRSGLPFVATQTGLAHPFGGRTLTFDDPRPGKDHPLKNLISAVPGVFGDWFVVARGWKSLLRYTAPRQGSELMAAERPEIADVARDELGQIYVLEDKDSRVTRLGLDLRPRGGAIAGGWKQPVAVAVDALGHLYVLDRGNRQLDVFDADGKRLTRLGPGVGGGIELRNPVDVAVDGSGRVFIADTKLPFVVVLD